ncbi:hypothetical protein [Actinoplanes sp. GCM10030250]|uniref:hypothetical protein n=1 Tax=Actinoplanes sp. GCM10030250 TaxID=3273376 RepID=UPI0036140364
MLEESFQAYNSGHADGVAGHQDQVRADHPETGPDYRVGVVDGSVAAFQAELVAQVRRLLGESD